MSDKEAMLELVFDQFKAEVDDWKRQIEIQQEDVFTSTRNGKFIEITNHAPHGTHISYLSRAPRAAPV